MTEPFFKGVTFGFYARNGYFSSQQARTEVDKMAALGIEWVCLVSTVLQEAFYSTRQFRDFSETPADYELLDIIDYLHAKNIKVMLRPMIECWDGTQRCHLDFPTAPEKGFIIPGKPFHYWNDWFASYTHLTRHYTRLAARAKCEAYSLDSELNHTVGQSTHWLRVIEEARRQFSGHLTTSMINTQQFMKEAADRTHWFHALDSLGSSMYAPATDRPGTTPEQMAQFLQPAVAEYRAFADAYGKLFYFGECGCCAVAGAAKLPYYWANGGGYDGAEQARYLEAAVRAFGAENWWGGMFWWKWDEQNVREEFRDDPAGDKGFTIDGKPAAQTFRRWCAGEF